MKLYNTETKKKEKLKPQKDGEIKIYSCGPTVYNFPHLGNYRTYINVDVLRRALKYVGFKVIEVTNITDIEDKIIRDAKKQKVFYKDLTKKFEKAFLSDIYNLNIEKPEFMPHATDEKVVEEMIKIISGLIRKGFAYVAEDGSVYFSIKKFKNYGQLSGLDRRKIKVGARVDQDEYAKDNPQDFVLWKAHKKGEPYWDAPFGRGRPGWHIECSAMSTIYLGNSVDIHAGGVDLIFPHHENEIAQSESYTGKKFVKYWFHVEHLLVNGKRMGKSEGNAYTLQDLKNKFNVEPLAFRLLVLMSHYREKLNFTEKSIKDAQNTLDNLRNFVTKISQEKTTTINSNTVEKLLKKAKNNFTKALENDLAMPKALAIIFELINELNQIKNISSQNKKDILNFFSEIDSVLALNLKPLAIPQKVNLRFKDYLKARKEKNWQLSDKIRKEIEELGWQTEDTQKGSILKRK